MAIMHLDEHDRVLPSVRAVRGCSLGRVVVSEEEGLLVAELVFDAPLRRGETVITEHELVNRVPYPADGNYERKFRLPVREYVLEVCFDTADPPVACERYARTAVGEERVWEVAVPASGAVHGVALDFGPGCFGFRWSW
ncbi:hypothetical protein ACFPM7_21770 [Actinokineospora guangxiensis]|uniref:Uncharacterized protein n=1 Tax=Actinokineospora guangxiensis TaxID=1490288 RepID=A0ABW0EQY5_9PSEU